MQLKLGVLDCADGDNYDGEWRNDKKNGKGKLSHCDKKIYEGDWKEDKKCGKGKFFIKLFRSVLCS